MVLRYKFQHFLDIKTSSASLNIIKVAAGGEYVRERCKHLFGTYKYWKLGRISIKLVPASTLPVDPLGLSLADDDPNSIDPRDQMNPGLVRITNGEDILSNLVGIPTSIQDEMYKATMLDPRWSKFMLQSGFSRSAYPLYWQIGQLHQDVYPGATTNVPVTDTNGIYSTKKYTDVNNLLDLKQVASDESNYSGFFQTGHRGRLGWMPTDAFEYFPSVPSSSSVNFIRSPLLEPIPEIDCITIVLPRANKTVYYYRLFVTEEVLFSGIKNVGISHISSGTKYECRAIDNFTYVDTPLPVIPSEQKLDSVRKPIIPNDGSGGGRP